MSLKISRNNFDELNVVELKSASLNIEIEVQKSSWAGRKQKFWVKSTGRYDYVRGSERISFKTNGKDTVNIEQASQSGNGKETLYFTKSGGPI